MECVRTLILNGALSHMGGLEQMIDTRSSLTVADLHTSETFVACQRVSFSQILNWPEYKISAPCCNLHRMLHAVKSPISRPIETRTCRQLMSLVTGSQNEMQGEPVQSRTQGRHLDSGKTSTTNGSSSFPTKLTSRSNLLPNEMRQLELTVRQIDMLLSQRREQTEQASRELVLRKTGDQTVTKAQKRGVEWNMSQSHACYFLRVAKICCRSS